jgi:hypothetical protein
MTRYDILTETTIAGSRADCYAALVDEAEGRATWWEPYIVERPQGGLPVTTPGAEVVVSASSSGHPERAVSSARWTQRTTYADPNSVLAYEYVDGDFRGNASWTFTDAEPGYTHIAVRFAADPVGMMRVLSYLMPIGHQHERLTELGFESMEKYLADHATKKVSEEGPDRRASEN